MTEQRPRVSIGLPVYNGERYLEEAVDSILNQTFTDLELVIGDNGSTDRTEEICRDYAAKDKRVRYIRHQKNLGASANFNGVFHESRGEYFKWQSYDDLCAPTKVERCVEVLDEHPDVVLAYPQVDHIDENGDFMEHYDSRFDLQSEDPIERFADVFKAPPRCSPVFGLIRRDVMAQSCLLGRYIASDRVLLGELALRGKFHEIKEPLFFRRIHPEISTEANRSNRALAAWFDPANYERLHFPTWKLLIENQRSVFRVPLTWGQRLRGTGVVLGYFLPPRKIPYMMKELVMNTTAFGIARVRGQSLRTASDTQ